MQPQGLLLEENMFVAVQKDNLPPPRVTTAMNIGRGQATGTISRKKAKTITDGAHVAKYSGTTRGGGRGERACRTRGRGGTRGGRGVCRNNEDARGFKFLFHGNGEQSHVAPKELNTTQSAPEENMAQDEPLLGDLNLHL
jgi:hypothetical protein